MPGRKIPTWKLKAKSTGSDLSPKELQWEERQKDANLQHNAAIRQARLAKRLGQQNLEVPQEVVEWFDRCRIALLATLEEAQGKSKNKKSEGGAGEGGAGMGSAVGAQGHKTYISTKFEKRGLLLYSVLQQVAMAQARPKEENMGLSLARQIMQQEIAGGKLGDGGEGTLLHPLRVVSIGGGPGTDLAALLWVSRHFCRCRAIDATLLELDDRWRRHLGTVQHVLHGTQLLPAGIVTFETADWSQPLMSQTSRRRQEDVAEVQVLASDGEVAHEGNAVSGSCDATAQRPDHGISGDDVEQEEESHGGHYVRPNAKAHAAIYCAERSPVDLYLVSYACHDRIQGSWDFFTQLLMEARQGATFVFIDVLHRSRQALDELYEAMLSALEDEKPKEKAFLTIEELLEISTANLQHMLLDTGPSHQAIERRCRQLSLRVHPDKNIGNPQAQEAFNKLQIAKEDVIRGHELQQAEDGSTVIKQLSVTANTGNERGDCPGGLLLRFDVPPTENIRAEVMILVKGPWKPRPMKKPRAIRDAENTEPRRRRRERGASRT